MSSKTESAASSGKRKGGSKSKRQRKAKSAQERAEKLLDPELPASDNWGEWVQHLSSRSTPVDLVDLIQHASTHPLKWALPDTFDQLSSEGLWEQLTRLKKGRRFVFSQVVPLLQQWLSEASERQPDSLFALECLAWCHALPRLGPVLPESDWRGLLEQLEEIIEAASGIAVHEDPVAHQLLNGELPISLAYLLPEISRYRTLRESATAALSFGAVELMDGEGLLNARHVDLARELLACWTRCSLLATSSDWDCFDDDGRNQYEWAVQQFLRWSRRDGSQVLSHGRAGQWCSDLIEIALHEGGDQLDAKIAAAVLPGGSEKLSDRQASKLPEPSLYSEWAEACVMRSKWSRKSPQFSCLFCERELRTELSVGGRVIWSGESNPELYLNGRLAEMTSDWSEVCWFSDRDVDYLELEAQYAGGWRIQRQMLLARRDDFFLLADAVLGPDEAEIRYDSRLPLADGIHFLPEEATCEGYLKDDRPRCTVLPLSLPEWRSASPHGSLQLDGSQLHLTLNASSRRLYAPLFIDLASRRWIEKRTWRQLTVAERLEIQPSEVAAGYRVQLGRKQWLIYRSLAPSSSRTLLGQNLSQEFVVGRFDSDGYLKELIEIE